jgi:hypothetical protein
MRQVVDALAPEAGAERVATRTRGPGPVRGSAGDLVVRLLALEAARARVEPVGADLEPAQRLLQGLLERAPDRHHLAHRLHLRGEARVRGGELLEREARDLGDHVVDGRLERSRRAPAGDLVAKLVQRVSDRELGRDLGDREAGRLRGQRRGPRHARVHLDHHHAAVLAVHAELHVRAAGVDADLAQHRDRGVAQALVFLVGEGERGRDRDRVAGVHAHRVEVLDRAHDDAVVGGSRTTSISNSFQPSTDSSTSTSCTGESSSPRVTISTNSSRL